MHRLRLHHSGKVMENRDPAGPAMRFPGFSFPSLRSWASAHRRALSLAGGWPLVLALAGCQSITGDPTPAQVRIIDASPDAPGADVYHSSSPLAYNLSLGTITSYIQVPAGPASLQVDVAGTRQHLAVAQTSFQPGGQYTVLVGNFSNNLQQIILKDQNTPAPPGQINVRFVHQSSRAGAVDLYLVPAGSTVVNVKPVLTNVAYTANTGYLTVPAGTYTLVALPAGTIATADGHAAYSGPSVSYQSGSARTFVLVDQQLMTTPGIQVISGSDFEPEAKE